MTRVLLVDDNDRQRKLSRVILEDVGYIVDDASNALDALERAHAQRPDIVLSDVMMDHIDGFGLCRRLQDDPALAAIAVVLVSAHYDDYSARDLAKTLGAFALVPRTPDFSSELYAIRAALDDRRQCVTRKRPESYEAHLEANAKQLTKLLEQTRRAELRWRAMFDHAHDVVTLVAPDGTILEANSRWQHVIGVTPSELVGHHFRDFAPEGMLTEIEIAFQSLLANGTLEAVLPVRHANGSTVHIEFVCCVMEHDGEANVIATGRDVTAKLEAERRAAAAEAERRALEERLVHAQRVEMIGQLTGGIAHDFNNVLCAVLANVDFLISTFDDADPRLVDANEIRSAAQRATALAGRLLEFSRQHALEVADLEIGKVVGSVGRMVHRILGNGIELSITECAEPAMVRADAVQLEQVLVNLVVNARDAMPNGGKLGVTTAVDGDRIVLSVSDTGCGMSPETQRRLFEPFFTTKPRGQGTGLGLSTCFGIVQQLGGEIRVTSELGRGTTMSVYLPRVREEQPSEVTPRTTARIRLIRDLACA